MTNAAIQKNTKKTGMQHIQACICAGLQKQKPTAHRSTWMARYMGRLLNGLTVDQNGKGVKKELTIKWRSS